MILQIKHLVPEEKSTQTHIDKGVYKIEIEYQPYNANTIWLHIYSSGTDHYKEYWIEYEPDLDTISILD